ncbi:MAG: hypothetical protein OHK005_06810 [Candidatus Methylacidiphilales bacterium]
MNLSARIVWLLFATTAFAPAAPQLPVVELTIESAKLQAEVAVTPAEQARGLMFRDTLPTNAGMLFVFPEPRRASFWMRNTSLPLSIAYLGRDGTILEIYDLEPFNETPVVSQSQEVWFALEVNRDWFRSRQIKPGDRVTGLPAKR